MRTGSDSRNPRRRLSWRLFWLAMLLLHVPITASVFSSAWQGETSGATWFSILLLSASNLFFVLEVVFASSIRVLTHRHGAIVLLLVVAVLHGGAIERSFHSDIQGDDAQSWLALAAVGAVAWRELWRVLTARPRVVDSEAIDCGRRLAGLTYAFESALVPAPCRSVCGWHRAPLRAPPEHF